MSKTFAFPDNGVVSWGRSFPEYCAMLGLDEAMLKGAGRVLDVAAGPASFTVEARARGINVTAVDPIYAKDAAAIRAQFDATRPAVLAGYNKAYDRVKWDLYGSPEGLVQRRTDALELFLADYDEGKKAGRYVIGKLPELPFPAASFGLATCSHMMFLYSHALTFDFHIAALTDVLRVAREARVFPLLTLDGERSPYLDTAMAALTAKGFAADIVQVPFEFQRGGNIMLRLRNPP